MIFEIFITISRSSLWYARNSINWRFRVHALVQHFIICLNSKGGRGRESISTREGAKEMERGKTLIFLVSYSLVHDSKENEFKWIEQGTLSVMGSIINLRGIVLFPSPHPPPPWTRTFIFGAPMTEVTWFMCGDVESVMYLNSKGKNGNFLVCPLKRDLPMLTSCLCWCMHLLCLYYALPLQH